MGEGESLVLLLVYVDDILLFSSSDKEIDGVQRKLTEQFKCKSLGEARYYLGMHIERDTELGGYICMVGGGPVSWRSKKQSETALSSVESER
ncbi:hypothetical protein CLOM_g6745 [Closterium sp. NIES-68]|nr:hypothetical protein CLOM_g6745 [Closterium sp. NIES-68]